MYDVPVKCECNSKYRPGGPEALKRSVLMGAEGKLTLCASGAQVKH